MSVKWSIILHAGAGPDSEFIRANQEGILKGLMDARLAAEEILKSRGHAVDAVEAAVRMMEDDMHFNAGRGSSLNNKGEVEMCASIMEGTQLKAGAAAVVQGIKNPVALARKIMDDGKCVYVSGTEACAAVGADVEQMPGSYFVTNHRVAEYLDEKNKAKEKGVTFNAAMGGTVGAVAFDQNGRLAAATSTGGTGFALPGRIGDSSMIGVGTYADDRFCGVSCTGDGEHLIRHTAAHSLVSLIEYKKLSAPEAARELIHKKLAAVKGDIGLVCIDFNGNTGFAFNTERMPRCWNSSDGDSGCVIYT